MVSIIHSFSNVLTSSVVSMSGLTIPANEGELEPLSFDLAMNSFLNDEFQLALNGPMTITLPKGLKFVDLTSSSGNILIEEVSGRQKITYTVPYGDFEDTISFRFQVTWYFFFLQLWKYIAIVVILFGLAVRQRRKRKQRKRKIRNASKAYAADKVSISPTEFADLSGFHSKGIHGDMEALKDYSDEKVPPKPPMSSHSGITAVQHVDMGDYKPD